MIDAWELLARIVLRYGIGAVVGGTAGTQLSADGDMVALVALVMSVACGAVVEWWTDQARKAGRKT